MIHGKAFRIITTYREELPCPLPGDAMSCSVALGPGNIRWTKPNMDITSYGPWADLPYYNLTTTDREVFPYSLPGDALNCYVGLSPLNILRTKPCKAKTKKIRKSKQRAHHKTVTTTNVYWLDNTCKSHATFFQTR